MYRRCNILNHEAVSVQVIPVSVFSRDLQELKVFFLPFAETDRGDFEDSIFWFVSVLVTKAELNSSRSLSGVLGTGRRASGMRRAMSGV